MGVDKRGGQLRYSNIAIETALTLRVVFNLPLRQTEGFLSSIFEMMGLDLRVPDHTTLSRRGAASSSKPNFAEFRRVKPLTSLSTAPASRLSAKASGRRRWTKESGCHRQGTVENAFFRYKSILGDCLRVRVEKGQEAEALLACNVLNRMFEMGRPTSVAIGP